MAWHNWLMFQLTGQFHFWKNLWIRIAAGSKRPFFYILNTVVLIFRACCGKVQSAVQWRRNLRKSWNHPEILILHKLSGKLLSPWKLTTEDKPQTLIDLESRDFKILHPHTSHPRFLENCQNWHFSHMIRCCVFWGTWQNYDWTMSETDLEWKLWTLL